MTLDFLYCFDKNFNLQALTAMNSLLDNVSEDINLHIIHKDVHSFKKLQYKLTEKNRLKNINFYKYNSDVKLPKIDAHFSETTYYRIFIEEYLPENVDFIIYLDADILCLNDPIFEINKSIKKMKKEETILAAATEGSRDNNPELFKKMELNSDNYFNAGVLIIDFEKWKLSKTQEKLTQILKIRFDKIFHFDQELLNINFDNNYTELSKYLNYGWTKMENNLEMVNQIEKDVYFLHYSGKGKPWSVENIIYVNAILYQKEFKKLNLQNYHIVFKKSFTVFRKYFKIIFGLKFLKLEYPLSFLRISITALFKKS